MTVTCSMEKVQTQIKEDLIELESYIGYEKRNEMVMKGIKNTSNKIRVI